MTRTSRFLRLTLTLVMPAIAQQQQQQQQHRAKYEPKTYLDSRGRKVHFPLGDASFAGEVVSFEPGKPFLHPRQMQFSDPQRTLGPPDFTRAKAATTAPAASLTLGCGGVLVLRFTNNVLVDVEGPDLYVFEVGPAIEATALAISTDGKTWIEAGKVAGGTAAVDIRKVVAGRPPGERYRFIRLTDLKAACSGPWPGADLDAVGAIGSALSITFDSSVLFDVDRAVLKPAAKQALTQAAAQLAEYAGSSIVIEGHTDSDGGVEHNQRLSQARAEAVLAFLKAAPGLAGMTMAAKGFGAARPVADNGTAEGKQLNRRVEVLLVPPQPPPAAAPAAAKRGSLR